MFNYIPKMRKKIVEGEFNYFEWGSKKNKKMELKKKIILKKLKFGGWRLRGGPWEAGNKDWGYFKWSRSVWAFLLVQESLPGNKEEQIRQKICKFKLFCT